MDPITEIRKKLEKYPNLKYESGGGFVVVHPASEDGFTVRFDTVIGEHDKPYIVNYEGWHEHFADPQEAINCFAFGLSSEARLRVHERGGKAYKWTLETKENGEWIPESTAVWFIFPFWRRRVVRHLQNNVIRDS